ncbi:hypothetical protein MTR67_019602 [Solanum verrucosum]|uniref:F-box/LRR-repeat protein 15/At3g58940/PEG3-like LRR domain-containing protein n=1 Tax=Solanum verrucosum TaxID=315347 RepID=A0AAF0QLT6_SOLVR|nr:hypothetical protein MTR67_019602 [Solanum verrucosum]
MSILSKTSLRSWFMHPNIDFKYLYRGGNLKIVDTIMDRYRDRKICIDKFELSYSYFFLISQPIEKWLDIALQNGVKYLFFEVSDYSLPIFIILAAKSLTELVVESCTLIPVSFSSGVTNCNSLRKLSLSHVKLDEDMLQTLLNCCPLIVSFIFDQCWGLKKIELLNLQKIKSVSIKNRKEQSQLVKIQAPTLEHLSYDDYLWGKLDIVEYCNRVQHLKIVLHCSGSLKAAWFCNLRKFLSISTSCPQVSLHCSQCNEIDFTDLQLHHGVATPKVDFLNIHCRWTDGECPTFLDALLWSCHPRRLNIRSTSATFKCFINRLICMKNLSHSSDPWHRQLKEAQAYIFDDSTSQNWHRVELNKEELSIRFDCKWKMVNYYF